MTTQIPYGSVPAEYPQFAAGHAQYPPAEHHAPYPQPGYAAHPGYPAAPAAEQSHGSYPAVESYEQQSYGEQSYAATPAYDQGGMVTGHAAYPAHYPPVAYPTAPPWATPEASAPQPQPVAPVGVPVVGGLLVPYPEEMQKAPHAQAPALWPVAVFTFLFGMLGAISAARRADQARRGGNGASPYWVTFAVTLVAGGFFWFVGGVAVGVPAYLSLREGAVVKQLEQNVVGDGQLAKANVTAKKAECRAAGDRRDDGTRDYLCRLTLSDGRTGQVTVTADEHGAWKPLTSR